MIENEQKFEEEETCGCLSKKNENDNEWKKQMVAYLRRMKKRMNVIYLYL